jgi:hypothetical protein
MRATSAHATPSARQRRHVAAAWDLHENGRTTLQCIACMPPGKTRQPSRLGCGIASQLRIVARRLDEGRVLTDDGAICGERLRPPGFQQRLAFRRTSEPADEQTCPGQVTPEHSDVARMRVRRTRLGQRVVAVVPDDKEAQLAHRCEHCGPGSDDDPHGSPADGEETPIALRRSDVGVQDDVMCDADGRRQCGVKAIDIAPVR